MWITDDQNGHVAGAPDHWRRRGLLEHPNVVDFLRYGTEGIGLLP
ncbi:MAG TPA: hypothetical protein VMP41_14080 [Acidimicrobiales bacterium]|nr:hypothetical protein [Acidimicrobiales bacterium]